MESLLQKLSSSGTYPFEVIALNLFYALVLGLFIALVYTKTHKGISYSQSFVHTLILICVISTLVMMVIGNNLARAFGLVGALSIIRFRTVVKDTKDTAYVFYALVVGMAIGTQAYLVALAGTLAISSIIAFLNFTNFGMRVRTNFLLKFRYHPAQFDETSFQFLVRRYFLTSLLMNVSTLRLNELVETVYDVEFKNTKETQKLLADLRAVRGVERVELVSTASHQEF
jgi:uncharacterized membrane protein YhiD involved in acid resistance